MKGTIHQVGEDPEMSLKSLKEKVEELIRIYGDEAVFSANAGYNNVTLQVDNRKSSIEKIKRRQR